MLKYVKRFIVFMAANSIIYYVPLHVHLVMRENCSHILGPELTNYSLLVQIRILFLGFFLVKTEID